MKLKSTSQLPNFSFTFFQFMVHCEVLNALSNSVLFLCINNSLSANQHLKIMHQNPKTVRVVVSPNCMLQFTFSQQFTFFCNSIVQLQLQMIWTPTFSHWNSDYKYIIILFENVEVTLRVEIKIQCWIVQTMYYVVIIVLITSSKLNEPDFYL